MAFYAICFFWIYNLFSRSAQAENREMTAPTPVRSRAGRRFPVRYAAIGNGDKVVPVSVADYYASTEGPIAPRPVHSALDLSKLEAAGFYMPDWEEELGEYLRAL